MAARRGANELAKLKEAEDEASRIVEAAREERKARMRQAVADAAKEIEEYKAMRELKLQSSNPEAEALIAKVRQARAESDHKMAAMGQEYAARKGVVTDMLLAIVKNIDNPYASTA